MLMNRISHILINIEVGYWYYPISKFLKFSIIEKSKATEEGVIKSNKYFREVISRWQYILCI